MKINFKKLKNLLKAWVWYCRGYKTEYVATLLEIHPDKVPDNIIDLFE